MKRIVSFLLVAIMAMALLSAPVFGQGKNESLIVSWAVEPSVAMKGQPVTLTAKVARGVPPYRLELNGHLVQNPHTFIPDSTASYGAMLSDSTTLRVPYAFKLPVLDYQNYDFEVLTLRDNETDVTTAVTWAGVSKQIADINKDGDFEVIITPTADRITTVSSRSMKGQKGIEANRAYQDSIGNGRGNSAYRELLALGVKNIRLEKPIIERPQGEKGVIISLRETKTSLARRFAEARQEVASVNSERTVMAADSGAQGRLKMPAKAAPDSAARAPETPPAIRWMMDNLAIGLGQQFGGYTGPTASLSANVWGNPDSAGWSLNLTGAIGRNSWYHDFTETYGIDAVVRYNLRQWIGAGFSAGYFKWSDVINNAKDPNYKDYKREFGGPIFGSWLFVGPIYGNIGWANGRHDDRRKRLPDVKDHVWDRVYRVGVDPIKLVKLVF